jgi:hypothetical protein
MSTMRKEPLPHRQVSHSPAGEVTAAGNTPAPLIKNFPFFLSVHEKKCRLIGGDPPIFGKYSAQ